MALKLQGTAIAVRRRYCNLDKQYKVKLYINTRILRPSLKDKCSFGISNPMSESTIIIIILLVLKPELKTSACCLKSTAAQLFQSSYINKPFPGDTSDLQKCIIVMTREGTGLFY